MNVGSRLTNKVFKSNLLKNMFSYIRERYADLDIPIEIPDCQLFDTSCCFEASLGNTRRVSQSNISIVQDEKPSTRKKSTDKKVEINEESVYDYDDDYKHLLDEYLKEDSIEPEKAEYKRLKEIDHGKHVLMLDAEVAKKDEHRRFNRYINIFPYDFNRIRLKTPVAGTDYINGSYVTGPLSKDSSMSSPTVVAEENLKPFEFSKFSNISFLATMGPLQGTVAHHWQAIYENDVDIIVMLTRLREGSSGSYPSTAKCSLYWPVSKEKPLRVANFEISMLEESQFTPEITKRVFGIKNLTTADSAKEEKQITQLQYTGWPDYGVPEEGNHLTNLVKKVRYIIQCNQTKIANGKRFTILAHCSAGVGRTGTFIVMYQMMDLLEEILLSNNSSVRISNTNEDAHYIDIFNAVLSLRAKRVEMVQSWAQYKYLYKSIAEYAKQVKSLNEASNDYVDMS